MEHNRTCCGSLGCWTPCQRRDHMICARMMTELSLTMSSIRLWARFSHKLIAVPINVGGSLILYIVLGAHTLPAGQRHLEHTSSHTSRAPHISTHIAIRCSALALNLKLEGTRHVLLLHKTRGFEVELQDDVFRCIEDDFDIFSVRCASDMRIDVFRFLLFFFKKL